MAKSNQKKIVTSNSIAILALVVSVVSAGFAIYQWWIRERENQIIAAIELSKNYYKDIDGATRDAVMNAYDGKTISEEQGGLIARFADQMDYVAFLANNGRLDQKYLSQDIQCGMLFAFGAYINMKKAMPALAAVELPDIVKFAPHAQCDIKAAVDSIKVR